MANEKENPAANCTHECSSCGENCSERQSPESMKIPQNKHSNIKKVIAVMSGKGGVGKSLTTSLLAINAQRDGKKTAIIDADVTGPSIPTIFGLNELAKGSEEEIFPVLSKTGIETISLNSLMDDPSEPVIWRGPVVSGLIRQFWSDVKWGDIDELYVDMPPGTSDVPLTVFQALPVDAIVVVTSPQELVSLIVSKAVKMANMMNIPVIAVVENMAYMVCGHCGEKVYPFGEPSASVANEFGIPVYANTPLDPKLASLCDQGKLEDYEGRLLGEVSDAIHALKK